MKPEYSFRTKVINSKEYLFDEIRKKWVIKNPEEVVRQNFWKYLHYEKKYPKSLITLEKQILTNGLKKRYDILIFNNNGLPELIVECKAPAIKINDDTLSQVLSYQKNIQANYLILTNGVSTYSLYINVVKKKVEFLDDIPSYNS